MVPFVALLVVPNWIPVNLKVLFQQQKHHQKKGTQKVWIPEMLYKSFYRTI